MLKFFYREAQRWTLRPAVMYSIQSLILLFHQYLKCTGDVERNTIGMAPALRTFMVNGEGRSQPSNHTNKHMQLQTVAKGMKKSKGYKRPCNTEEGITFIPRLEE